MTKLKVAFLFDESNNWLSKFFDEYIITKNGCDVHQFVYAEKYLILILFLYWDIQKFYQVIF